MEKCLSLDIRPPEALREPEGGRSEIEIAFLKELYNKEALGSADFAARWMAAGSDSPWRSGLLLCRLENLRGGAVFYRPEGLQTFGTFCLMMILPLVFSDREIPSCRWRRWHVQS
jgi:hypothetical protein